MSQSRSRFDAHTLATAGGDPDPVDGLNRTLWVALVTALATFLRAARPALGMRHGETCPKCGWKY